jgi:hypothetical protein
VNVADIVAFVFVCPSHEVLVDGVFNYSSVVVVGHRGCGSGMRGRNGRSGRLSIIVFDDD